MNNPFIIDAKLIATTCSQTHVKSVIEDLVEIIRNQQVLVDEILKLNPNCDSIGHGKLHNMIALANSLKIDN